MTTRLRTTLSVLLLPVILLVAASRSATAAIDETSLVEAAPAAHREAVGFLVRHMPARDRGALTEAFLLEHVAARMEARERAPWGRDLPESVFLNDVLPYAVASETREPLSAEFIELCRRITADASDPGEAALALNRELFTATGVRYGTQRRRPDQSVSETMEQGVATCTGLSVMLVQACRAVAVPARIAGVASWADDRGNHTWVEVFDGRGWRFVGAAEPDAKGFDHGWFTGDAARAVPGHPRYAVMASSWAATDRHFPMVWAPGDRSVPGIDVTGRYLRGDSSRSSELVRVMVRLLGPDGRRVVGTARVTDQFGGGETLRTMGPEADMHRHAEVSLANDRILSIAAETDGGEVAAAAVDLRTAEPGETRLITLHLEPGVAERAAARAWFDAWFAADEDARAAMDPPADLERWLRSEAGDAVLRRIAFEAWRAAPIHTETAEDMAANRVRAGGKTSPYTVKEVGEKPESGWALVIAMHGGGGVPKEFNDRQWEHMQRYYREQPRAGGYLYVALRAPTDEWNGFYTGYVYPLIEQLIAQFIIHRDVDPQRVYAIGYSHGGYGAYAIGPKLPDRFAAVHASAAAATDGEIAPETLLNLRFTAMIGELDTAFGRVERNRRFRERIEQLQAEHGRGGFPVRVIEIAGNGHTGLPDRDWLTEMLPHDRTALPEELWWHQSCGVVRHHYWLADDAARSGRVVRARRQGNAIDLEVRGAERVQLRLDARLADLNRPVRVRQGGRDRTLEVSPSLRTLAGTMLERRDPVLAATVVLDVPVAEAEADAGAAADAEGSAEG
jgi:predicted esterase